MVTPVPTKIIWSYGEWQPSYQSLLDKVDFVQGLPDLPPYSQEPLLVVIDDQMHAHYLVIFKNPRDGSVIVHLAKQMYLGKKQYVRQAFALVTRQAHGYLLIDLKQSTPEGMRLRSYIFPGDCQEVYLEDI